MYAYSNVCESYVLYCCIAIAIPVTALYVKYNYRQLCRIATVGCLKTRGQSMIKCMVMLRAFQACPIGYDMWGYVDTAITDSYVHTFLHTVGAKKVPFYMEESYCCIRT